MSHRTELIRLLAEVDQSEAETRAALAEDDLSDEDRATIEQLHAMSVESQDRAERLLQTLSYLGHDQSWMKLDRRSRLLDVAAWLVVLVAVAGAILWLRK